MKVVPLGIKHKLATRTARFEDFSPWVVGHKVSGYPGVQDSCSAGQQSGCVRYPGYLNKWNKSQPAQCEALTSNIES